MRGEWGADASLGRRGWVVPVSNWKHITEHHTVIIDNDATPNLWETKAEVFQKMRQLQVIRPDLGNDVPYSWVIFLMADGTIIVCEGRGLRHTGAHTIGHNSDSQGVAFEGDFENFRVNIGPYIPKVNHFFGWLKFEAGASNLGARLHSIPAAQTIHYHQMFSQTACPGGVIINNINSFKYVEYKPQEEDTLSSAEYDELNKRIGGTNTALELVAKSLKETNDTQTGQITAQKNTNIRQAERLGNHDEILEEHSDKLGYHTTQIDIIINAVNRTIARVKTLVSVAVGLKDFAAKHTQMHNTSGGANDMEAPAIVEGIEENLKQVEDVT